MRISSINSQELFEKKDLSANKKNDKKSYLSANLNKTQPSKSYNPNFGSLGMSVLGGAGSLMQSIEHLGYFIAFLIQDGLGMTLPRVWTGFHRDKDITGKYNIQEGLEVGGREGLTGPYIIAVAPAVLALTGKFCKSTNSNTRLIKRFGASLKNMISNPNFDKSIKQDTNKFRSEFFKYNLEKMYKASVPNDKESQKSIEYIVEEFEKYASSKNKKDGSLHLNNIVSKFNNELTNTSKSFFDVNRVLVGEGETQAKFSTSEALRALRDFGDDAILNNKHSAEIEEKAVDNIKNNFATKRLLTNIANIVITLGGLAILPKLYARSEVAPGAKVAQLQKENAEKTENIKNETNKNNKTKSKDVSFKGKGINGDGILARTGKLITKYVPEKMHDLLEYTGYNFSKTTFALLSLFGLLVPRGKRAWDRAQVDENGKKDKTELIEIGVRDSISSLSVVFAVPLLTKAMVKSYENAKGFILTNRASDGKNSFKKLVDIINPYSALEVLSIADLDSIYGNIDNKSKLLNFSNFINEKGGDLAKIISKSENASELFNENSFTLESLKDLNKQQKNEKIISFFNSLDIKDAKTNNKIAKMMKGSGELKNNKIIKLARGLNSLPGLISLTIISPLLLGYLLPELTYMITRKINAKKMKESKTKVNNVA